jgi:hypothetical protein
MSQETNLENQETNLDKNKTQTNEYETINSAIQAKLIEQSELLKRLAEKPEDVKSDGLKHLSEQSATMAKQLMNEFTAQTNEFKSRLDSYELELAKRDIMAKYGLGDEHKDLFEEIKDVEKLEPYAKRISSIIISKAGKPSLSVPEEKIDVHPSLRRAIKQ